MLSSHDKQTLRALADEYMSFATLPIQKEKIWLWRALNRGAMQRPMVTMDQLPWDELACEELVCRVGDRFWRGMEHGLRRMLYKWKHFPVDMVLDPYIAIPKAVTRAGYGVRVREEIIGPEGSTCRSHRYINQLL